MMKSAAIRISIISIIVNLGLTAFKLVAGLVGHSQALVADAVHSASDVISTIIVIVSLVISSRSADANHEYGHQKFESIATLFLAILLAEVGVRLGINGVKSIINKEYLTIEVPTTITIIAAAISIATKEIMYHFTMHVAKKEQSNALKADAWHHRSDALSSIGSLAGVLFAIFGVPIMDSIASIIICIFILKTAIEIVIEGIKGLTDVACDQKTVQALRDKANSVPGVLQVDSLKSRIFGSGYYIDMEIQADRNLSFVDAHNIAEQVHDTIEKDFPRVWHCMVHVNPSPLEKKE